MSRVRLFWLIVGYAAFSLAFFFGQGAVARDSVRCDVSRNSDGIEFGTSALRAWVPPDGKFVFHPGGPGFVDRDGALGIKFGWFRGKQGHLSVSGRRLDGVAPPARTYLIDYGDSGFQPTYLVFPTPGCWQITGTVADVSLTFTVFVEKVGEGPSWRYEGVPHTWRVTS